MRALVVASVTIWLFCKPPPANGVLCGGDCNGDGIVTVDEIVRAVTIALDQSALRRCPPADSNGDQQVTINELVSAVDNALDACPATVTLFRAPEVTAPSGPLGNGDGVLPNGRRVAPAGLQVSLDTLPLNMALTPDARSVLLTNDGWGNQDGERGLQVVDLASRQSIRVEIPHFFGLALAPTGDRVFVSDGDTGTISALRLQDGAWRPEAAPIAHLTGYPTGLAVSHDGSHLYVVGLTDNRLHSIDLGTNTVHAADVPIGNFPYTVILSADDQRAYVSSWGLNNNNPISTLVPPLPPPDPNAETRSSVASVDLTDPDTPKLIKYAPIARSLSVDARTIFGGSHPSAMALSPDGRWLYVAATNMDLLVVLDSTTLDLVAEVPLNPFETGPLATQLQGFSPDALAVRADGRRVYVADAGINAVEVVDVDPAIPAFTPKGFIPVGWYPSALALGVDGTLYVANAKGAGVGPNIGDPLGDPRYYIGRVIRGSLSIIGDVDAYDLAAGTDLVRDLNGFRPVQVQWSDGSPDQGTVQRGSPIPIDYGSAASDKIKHVVFILKENRTYDQVFGDLPVGNGDPGLVIYGQQITPNAHAIAQQFALGDNFYCDGEVSLPGHEWTDQAESTDFTEKIWTRNDNAGISDLVAEFGQEGFAKNGYIFEALQEQGVSYRVYGETFHFLTRYVAGVDSGGVPSIYPAVLDAFGGVPGVIAGLANLLNGDVAALEKAGVNLDELRTKVWPNIMIGYPANIIPTFPDAQRAALFLSELQQFEQQGQMPSFVFIWLPNDHTWGAAPGNPTPDEAVADNDDGLGKIVDGLTHSSFWSDMAIFVTEDDSQDGQDHVSAHRSLSLVISPYVKHGYVSHVHNSLLSIVKTIELLLGVRPLTEYDRSATDMRDYFTTTADLSPYAALPKQVAFRTNPEPEDAPNAYLRRAAELSEDLNLSTYDEAGENLGLVLWLVHAGEQLEVRKARAAELTALGVLGMLTVAFLIGRRQASRRVASNEG
jgi:DNA-binding beta-propeller fold protein YncE